MAAQQPTITKSPLPAVVFYKDENTEETARLCQFWDVIWNSGYIKIFILYIVSYRSRSRHRFTAPSHPSKYTALGLSLAATKNNKKLYCMIEIIKQITCAVYESFKNYCNNLYPCTPIASKYLLLKKPTTQTWQVRASLWYGRSTVVHDRHACMTPTIDLNVSHV